MGGGDKLNECNETKTYLGWGTWVVSGGGGDQGGGWSNEKWLVFFVSCGGSNGNRLEFLFFSSFMTFFLFKGL